VRTLARLVSFGAAEWRSEDRTALAVHEYLRTVPARYVEAWPALLLDEHVNFGGRPAGAR
jgi:hypothetical protein